MKPASVYLLRDPRSLAPRYVGLTTTSLRERLANHLRNARWGEKTDKAGWLRQLLKQGVAPLIELVEENASEERERFWIAEFKRQGHDLVNATNGGRRGTKFNESVKERMRLRPRAPISEETRKRLCAAQKGRKVSEETKEKLRRAHKGRKHSPMTAEQKEKIAASKRGKPRSKETRDKISKALAGKPTGRIKHTCRNGHDYTPENMMINVRGARECRICRTASFRKSYQKRRLGKS